MILKCKWDWWTDVLSFYVKLTLLRPSQIKCSSRRVSSRLGVEQIFRKVNEGEIWHLLLCFMTSSSRNRIEFEPPTVTRRSTLSTTAERRGNNTLISQASSAEALHMTHGECFLLLQARSSKQKKLHDRRTLILMLDQKVKHVAQSKDKTVTWTQVPATDRQTEPVNNGVPKQTRSSLSCLP